MFIVYITLPRCALPVSWWYRWLLIMEFYQNESQAFFTNKIFHVFKSQWSVKFITLFKIHFPGQIWWRDPLINWYWMILTFWNQIWFVRRRWEEFSFDWLPSNNKQIESSPVQSSWTSLGSEHGQTTDIWAQFINNHSSLLLVELLIISSVTVQYCSNQQLCCSYCSWCSEV